MLSGLNWPDAKMCARLLLRARRPVHDYRDRGGRRVTFLARGPHNELFCHQSEMFKRFADVRLFFYRALALVRPVAVTGAIGYG